MDYIPKYCNSVDRIPVNLLLKRNSSIKSKFCEHNNYSYKPIQKTRSTASTVSHQRHRTLNIGYDSRFRKICNETLCTQSELSFNNNQLKCKQSFNDNNNNINNVDIVEPIKEIYYADNNNNRTITDIRNIECQTDLSHFNTTHVPCQTDDEIIQLEELLKMALKPSTTTKSIDRFQYDTESTDSNWNHVLSNYDLRNRQIERTFSSMALHADNCKSPPSNNVSFVQSSNDQIQFKHYKWNLYNQLFYLIMGCSTIATVLLILTPILVYIYDNFNNPFSLLITSTMNQQEYQQETNSWLDIIGGIRWMYKICVYAVKTFCTIERKSSINFFSTR